jgi:hypothetical protein
LTEARQAAVDRPVSADRWVESGPAQLQGASLEVLPDDSDTARTGPAAQEIFGPLAARPSVSVRWWYPLWNPLDLPLPDAALEALLASEM